MENNQGVLGIYRILGKFLTWWDIFLDFMISFLHDFKILLSPQSHQYHYINYMGTYMGVWGINGILGEFLTWWDTFHALMISKFYDFKISWFPQSYLTLYLSHLGSDLELTKLSPNTEKLLGLRRIQNFGMWSFWYIR